MERPRTAPWLNVAAALAGGLMLGFGLGKFVHHPAVGYGVITVLGIIILWYAVSDYHKRRPGAAEGEAHGRTIE